MVCQWIIYEGQNEMVKSKKKKNAIYANSKMNGNKSLVIVVLAF